MRKLKILALSTLAVTLLVALSISVAGACDGAKKADAATASAATCPHAAAMETAGATCPMAAKTAMAGHCSSMAAHGPSDLTMEAVRLPSGALAVFYSGKTDATIASLQAKASMSPAEMGCDIAKCMATNKECHVEVAKTSHGLMMLVTSDKADVLDQYQHEYEIAMATPPAPATDASGE